EVRRQYLWDLVPDRDEPVAELADRAQRQWTVGRQVERDRMDEIEEPEVLVEETDRSCHPVQRVLDLLAGKQRANDVEVFAEIADLHRVHAHHAHGGVASPD